MTGISLGTAGFVVAAALIALAIFVRTETFQNGLRDRILQIARQELDVSIGFESARVEIFTLEPKIHFQKVVVSDDKQKVSVSVDRVAAGISIFSLPLLAFRQLVLSTAELEGLQYPIRSTRIFDRWLKSFRPRSGFVPVRFQTSVKRVILSNVNLDVDLPASDAGGHLVKGQFEIDTAQVSLSSDQVTLSGLISARNLQIDQWGPYDLELSLDRGSQVGSKIQLRNLRLKHEDNFLSVSGVMNDWKNPILDLTGEGSIDIAKYFSDWKLYGKIEGDFKVSGPWRLPHGSGTAKVINGQWRIKKFDELSGSWNLKDGILEVPRLEWKQGAESGSGQALIPFVSGTEARLDVQFKNLNIASYVGLADPILSKWRGEAEGTLKFRGNLSPTFAGQVGLEAKINEYEIRSFGETSILRVPGLKVKADGKIEESVRGSINLFAETEASQSSGTAEWNAQTLDLQWNSKFDGRYFGSLFDYRLNLDGELKGQLFGPWSELVLEAQPNFKNFKMNGQDINNLRGMLRLANRRLMAAPLNADQASLLGGIYFASEGPDKFQDLRFTLRGVQLQEIFGYIGILPENVYFARGKLSGKGNLTGELFLPTGAGRAQVEDWQFGQSTVTKGRIATAQWGCGRGQLYFDQIDAKISERSGRVTGDLSIDGRGIVDTHLTGEDLRFSDWTYLLGADLGIQARTMAEFDYQRDIPSAQLGIRLLDTSFGAVTQPDSRLNFQLIRDRLTATASLFGESFKWAWKSQLEGTKVKSTFDIQMQAMNLSPWIPFVSPLSVETLMTGSGSFSFVHSRAQNQGVLGSLFHPPTEARGSVQSKELILRKTSMILQKAEPFEIRLEQTKMGAPLWNLGNLVIKSADRSLDISGYFQNLDDFEFRFKGVTDLRVLSAFSSILSRSEGYAKVDGRLGPQGFSGKVSVEDALVTFQDVPLLMREVNADLSAHHSLFEIHKFQGEFRDGSMNATGRFHLGRESMDNADLRLQLDQVLLQPELGLSFKTSGPLRLLIDRNQGDLTGRLYVSEGLFRKRIDLRSDLGKFFKRERRRFQSRADLEGAWRKWKLNVQIVSQDPFQIRNNIGEGAANLNLSALGTAGEPRVGGNVELVRGQFTFQSREFQVRSGAIQFKDPQSNIPNYDIRADTEVEDYRVFMRLQGGPGEQKISYSSEPPLSEKDIISLISFGIPASAKELKNEDQSRSVGLTGFSFVTGAIQDRIEYRLSQDLGIQRFQLGPAFFDQTGRTELQLTVGTDLVKNKLAVNYSNFLSTTGGHKVELDFRVNRNVSLIGSWRDVRELEGRSGDSKDDFGGDLRFKFEFD